jgi:hypothetical protein
MIYLLESCNPEYAGRSARIQIIVLPSKALCAMPYIRFQSFIATAMRAEDRGDALSGWAGDARG